ncbi:Purple acid Phosphatase, N-terminal domain [Sporobacter termitidis DSM 10068]|uniref:Purple acid Phosphatase, N-terminal domain n=1 Tax=Sporobacter termitidis DSM 10068 TaxID=1123282 RepID=A0A1M5ZEJ9_9FIRM|nr:metallophosphoesterase [Sporobacter termitidis]SHI22611.1 Purple acid Phosphatase, N-terminal domain [Sporobacter termitidis DSM 10068]
MQTKRKLMIGVLLAAVLLLGAYPLASAATVHYNDASQTGGSAEWTAWTDAWEQTAADFTKVSLTPGTDATALNFAWYSASNGSAATPVVHFGTDKNNLQTYKGTSAAVDKSLTGDAAYDYNHVAVTGLKENTTYYYTVEKNGVQTAAQTYKTGSFENVKILLVGDPQIGASTGQPQGSGKLAEGTGADNTAARNDGFAWDRTLDIALAQNPDLNFVISAGDQVNRTAKPKEEEYAAYLSPSALASLPVATTIGNHDSLNPDYAYHFYNPNATANGATQAGGDYYYSYGDGLFVVLNTNNYNVAEHEATLKEAVASNPGAKWRIVTIHQDIYGSGLDHSDTDGMILRTQLTPVFDKYDVDVVLQGHDHTYSRSKILYGDSQAHGAYEFQLNDAKTDYDWNNAYNNTNSAKIPLNPADTDTQGKADRAAFGADNRCYNIESVAGSTVVNPYGTLYITANSASGSKFYELINPQQDYIAKRSQNWLPSYSVISMTAASFSIDTYQITAEGKTEKIDDTFTIQKTGAPEAVNAAMTRGEAVLRLYNGAGAPAVTGGAGFSDVSTGAAYYNAVAWAKAGGIVSGVSAASFNPDAAVTREQLAVMMYNYAAATGKPVSVDGTKYAAYPDAAAVAPWAQDAVKFAVNEGLLTGAALSPKETVSASAVDYALTKLGE